MYKICHNKVGKVWVMEMLRRSAEDYIQNWIKESQSALLISGARQIGKTYLIRECLRNSDFTVVEFNFIQQKDIVALLEEAKSSEELLMRLSLASMKPLEKGKTIIFFDEVQECKEIVTMIKFLVEEGSYKYILSGSLLGVELNDLRSAPVGYLEILDMYPLNFKEFLWAVGVQEQTIDYLHKQYIQKEIVDTFIHNKMMDIFYLYLIVGGMPEAVVTYLETNNLRDVQSVHEKIKRLYNQDFTKYEMRHKLKLREIYNAMASELDSKNKRFKFSALQDKARYRNYEEDFLWLKDAGVALPVYNISEPKVPLVLSENRSLFKLFYSDVGLLTSQYSDRVKMSILNKESNINNGSLFENVIAQELKSKQMPLYYYNNKKIGELDFVIEKNGQCVPIEVKSGKNYKKHSALENVLSIEEYGIQEAIIFSNYNIEKNGNKLYLPIYMIMFVENNKLENPVYKLDLTGL